MSNYIIRTERLGLRLWRKDDLLPLAEMNRDKKVMEYFPAILNDRETEVLFEKINTHYNEHGFSLYAVDLIEKKKFIGFTGFLKPGFESFFTPCIEIGWRLVSDEWGHGYATEAAKACLDYGFSSLNFKEIYSFTSIINTRSERVMQKIGLKKVNEFEHPKIARDHHLCKHVLYKIVKEQG